MRISTRHTERVQHVTLGVHDVPGMRIGESSSTYTPDKLTLSYSDVGAGWRLIAASMSGTRSTRYLRSSDAWSAKTINKAPDWVRTLAADNMPKDD